MGSDPGRRGRAGTGRRAATATAGPRPQWRTIQRFERASFQKSSASNRNAFDSTPVAIFRSTSVAILRRTGRWWTHGGSQQEQGILVSLVQRFWHALQRVAVPVQQRQQPASCAGWPGRTGLPWTTGWSWWPWCDTRHRRPRNRTGLWRRTTGIGPRCVPARHGQTRRRLTRSLSFETAPKTVRTSRISPRRTRDPVSSARPAAHEE